MYFLFFLLLTIYFRIKYREGKSSEYFCTTNLLSGNREIYAQYWFTTSFLTTYHEVRKTVTCTRGSQRNIAMYLYGSTLGRTNYPCYMDGKGYHNLPRPYADFKPGLPSRRMLDQSWFKEFVAAIEERVIFYLRELYPDNKKAKLTLFLLTLAKQVIPEECRISGSFFNHMTLLGNLSGDANCSISPHKDEEDVITALFHVGKPRAGGETLYYAGRNKKNPGKVVHSVEFQHGRLQIGFFDDTVHAAAPWQGLRGGINLNLKKNVLKFFQDKDLMKYYDQYALAGFPKKKIVAI